MLRLLNLRLRLGLSPDPSVLKCHRGVAPYRQTCSHAFTGACGSAPRRERQTGDESECDEQRYDSRLIHSPSQRTRAGQLV
jgi:hypothetical protein